MIKTITICSSANFYKTAVELQHRLQQAGFTVIIPITAEKMKKSGNFDAAHYRTWLKDASDYHKKAALMRGHFNEVEKADAVLVVNEKKHGIEHYIGGNVLMEMALAFHLGKPIYILNDTPSKSMFLEEIIAMEPIELKGDLQPLIREAKLLV
jgi:hypothetical protein